MAIQVIAPDGELGVTWSPRDEKKPFLDVEQAPDKTMENCDWLNTLRPSMGGSAVLLAWQQFCPFIPIVAFFVWGALLVAFLILKPIWVVMLVNMNLVWGLWEHTRWLLCGYSAIHKVIKGVDEKTKDFQTQHACMVATYKEDTEILRQTLLTLANQKGNGVQGQTFAQSFIGVNLCYEVREGSAAEEQAALLIEEFKNRFAWMTATFHPTNIPGDAMGKCSNLRWSIAHSSDMKTTSSALVTVLDADSSFDLQYFAEVTERYEERGDAARATIFQPTILHFGNSYDQVGAVMLSSMLASIGNACYHEDLLYKGLPYSTFTMPWSLIEKIGNFCPDYIADDWHCGIKSFLADPIMAHLEHIPLPVVNYAVAGDTWQEQFGQRWKQALRHALGIEDLGYIWQMLPACIARHMSQSQDEKSSQCCATLQILCKFVRMLCYINAVHIRLSWILPEQIIMMTLGSGIMYTYLNPDADHWPLYGEPVHDFVTSAPCVLNFVMTMVLLIEVVMIILLCTRVIRHLSAKGRITGEAPWWAQSPVQYLHDLGAIIWLPFIYACAAAAEVKALFTVPFLDKSAFYYEVATKPQLSAASIV